MQSGIGASLKFQVNSALTSQVISTVLISILFVYFNFIIMRSIKFFFIDFAQGTLEKLLKQIKILIFKT